MARNMGLSSGTKLGPYEIQSPLGARGLAIPFRFTHRVAWTLE